MKGLLLNFIDDWGISIREGLGQTGLLILIVVFCFLAMCLLFSIIKGFIAKNKVKIKWGHIFLTVLLVLFIIWFCILSSQGPVSY